MFPGCDADNNDLAIVATVDIAPGEVTCFTDEKWDGTGFAGTEQLFEWTVPTGRNEAGTVVTLDMSPGPPSAGIGGAMDPPRGPCCAPAKRGFCPVPWRRREGALVAFRRQSGTVKIWPG